MSCFRFGAAALAGVVYLLVTQLVSAAAYGVTVPFATTSGGVDNRDCVFAVRCAELPTGIGISGDTLPAPAGSGSDAAAVAAAATVYVGRAAGRCQRKLNSLKCALTQQIVLENQCRAQTWPDEEVAPVIPTTTLAACIVQQCHRQRIVIQYFYPRLLDSATAMSSTDLLYLQLDSIANYSTSQRCNTERDTRPSSRAAPVYDPPLEWLTVQQEVLLGPFGTSNNVPTETCSNATCRPPPTLPTGYAQGTCNVSTPLGFHCTLACLDGYECTPSSLQVQCAAPAIGVTTAGVLALPPAATPSRCELIVPAGYTAGTCTLTVLASGSSCNLQFNTTLVPVSCTRGVLNGLPLAFNDVSTLVRHGATQLVSSAGRRLLQEGAPIPGYMLLLRTVIDLNSWADLDNVIDQIMGQYTDYLIPPESPYTHFGQPIRLRDGNMVVSGVQFRDRRQGQPLPRANFHTPRETRNAAGQYYAVEVHEVTAVGVNGLPTHIRQLFPMQGQRAEEVPYVFDFPTGQGDLMEWAWGSITLAWLRRQFNPDTDGNEAAARANPRDFPLAPFRHAVRVFAVIQEVFRSGRIREFFIQTVQHPARPSSWIHGIHADGQGDAAHFQYPPNPPTEQDHRYARNLIIYRQWHIQCRLWMRLVLLPREYDPPDQRSLVAHGLPLEYASLYPPVATDVGLVMPSVLRLVQHALAARDDLEGFVVELQEQVNEWPSRFFNIGVQAPAAGDILDRMRAIFRDAEWSAPGHAVIGTVNAWLDLMAEALVERVQQTLPDLAPVPTPVAQGTLGQLFVLVAGVLHQRHAAGPAGGACGSGSPTNRRLFTADADCTAAVTASQIVAYVRRRSLPIDIARQFRVAAVGDMTSDGYSDLILRARQQRPCTSLLLVNSRNPHVPFPSIECLATNTTDAVITYGDFDGDGFMDQLIRNGTWPACGASHFGIVFGARNGSATRYECISSPRSDPAESALLVLARDTDSISWLVSQSITGQDLCSSHLTLLQPQWITASSYLAQATCVASTPMPQEHSELLSGDFDGDGQDDLFFICDNTVADCNGCPSRAGVLLLADAAATAVCFPHVLNSDSFPQPGAVQVVDINGDDVADIVLLRPLSSPIAACPTCGRVAVYPTLVSTITAAPTLSWPTVPYCTGPSIQPDLTCHVGDLNADGLPDLLVAHDFSCGDASSSYWLSVNGTSVFSEQRCMSQSFASISPTSFSTLIDINGDGVNEILTQASDEEFASIFFLPIEL